MLRQTVLVASLAAIGAAHAQQAPARLDQVVVTAARSAQQLEDVLPSSSVITRAEIEASQATDIIDLMRLQPGIDVARTGGPGSLTSVFMRGGNSSQVLLLVDGLRVNAVNGGAPDWRQLMLDDIERIEIVRGNVSALYGSEAIGGVVQVFTRAGRGAPAASLRLQAGGERTRSLGARAGGEFGNAGAKTRVSVTASSRSTAGFSAIDANRVPFANPDIDGSRNNATAVSVTQQIGAHELSLSTMSSRTHLDIDDPSDYRFFDPTYNGRGHTHVEDSRLSAGNVRLRLQLTDQWESTLQLGATSNAGNTVSSYPFSFAITSTRSFTRQLAWNNSYALTPTQTITAGVESLRQEGSDNAYPQTFTRRVNSAMAGWTGQFGAHEGQLAVRRDHYTDFGTASTGLAAYGFRLTPGWKLIAQTSTAFRAPSFNDLYFPFFGNPALRPERARSIEAGAQYSQGNDYLRVVAFRNRIRDLIVFDPLILIANNIAAARITGLEFTSRTRWHEWDLNANLTLQQPIDAQTGQRLVRRASHTLNLGVARSMGPWRYAADVSKVGARADTDILTFGRTVLPGYSVANLRVAREIDRHVSVGASLRNAFNARYHLVDGYNMPGRVLLFTLDMKS